MTTQQPPAADRPEDLPAAAEDEFVEAQVYQHEMDHPEEFANPIVDALTGTMPDHDQIVVPADEPLIEAEDELIESQVYAAQMNEAQAQYEATHGL